MGAVCWSSEQARGSSLIVTVADLLAGLVCTGDFSGTARMEVQPPGAVARLVLCLFARGVTLQRIGVAGVYHRGTFKL